MKNKLVMFAALLAVMAVMTGVAAAVNSISVDPGTIKIAKDGTATQDVTVTSDAGDITSLTASGDGFVLTDVFTVTIDGVETTSVSGSWASPKIFTIKYTNDKGVLNQNYGITYNATYIGGNLSTEEGLIEGDIVSVPEFPAVALPVAGILGLVFVLRMRRKEE